MAGHPQPAWVHWDAQFGTESTQDHFDTICNLVDFVFQVLTNNS